MGKQTQRIGLVQVDDDVRSPEREALAAAIANHAQLRAALDENVISQRRADTARWAATSAVDAANAALEEAKAADADSIAQGRTTGTTKLARANLTDAEDHLAACESAVAMLKEQAADLTNRLDVADSRVNSAVTKVLRASPEVPALIEQFKAANALATDLRETMEMLLSARAFGDDLRARNWDGPEWRTDIPQPTAARVKTWIAQLRTDADAKLVE
jgi:chromosome segregation ATPase